MQRNYLRGLLICLIPCLLAGVFAVRIDKYKLGIDLAGGTILVYEINLERTKQRKEAVGEDGQLVKRDATAAAGLSPEEMNQLAAQIKRRIDPTDIKNVTVRPLGDRRLEIILPTGGASSGKTNLTAEEIEETKRLISQMGVLEFRILANGADDAEGIAAARAAVDNESPEVLKALADEGKAPPGPRDEFNVEINGTKAKVRYVWAEVGPEFRIDLGLSNASEGTGGLWAAAAAARAAGKTFVIGPNRTVVNDNAVATEVLYSRVCTNRDQLAREEAERERLEREGKSKEEIAKLLDAKKYEYFVLTRVSPEDSVRVGGDITLTATAGTDAKTFNPCVEFNFNAAGAQVFGKITRRNKPSNNNSRLLAVLLDDRVVSSATIQSEITSHGQITGRFDRKTVERQVYILRSGALSAELREKPVSENTIGPTLGRDTITKGTLAVGLAFVAILVFMVAYYRFAGLVACIALFANLLLTVGFMVAVNAAFTLPGLAGLVLTLGIAVDANVLIYERLREERNKGANLITAIRNGYDRAFGTIIDTHMTSIFTAIVLYTFGTDNLKGFAISLTVGLVISLFTSLYMTRLMFDFWLHKRWLSELRMLKLFEKPNFHPMKLRFVMFTFAVASSLLGLGLFVARGEAGLNVDFRGGTVFAGKLRDGEERALTTTSDGKPGFRELLGEANQKKQLTATAAQWANKPVGDSSTANTFVYTISYADNSTTTVTLSHRPAGATDEEMAADVVARARVLPDWSVEQMFLAGEPNYGDGKSRYFTIRTTERQPELVRAALDRLLRDDSGKSLMAGATMGIGDATGPKVELTFSQPTSRAYVQEILNREFKKAGASGESDTFSITGDKATETNGRFTKMTVDVSNNPALAKLKGPDTDPEKKAQAESLKRILTETKQLFESAPEPERLEVFDSQLAKETRSKAFWAIALSWVAILLYLWFRFGNWTFGLAAVLCLIHDLCFTLGAIAVCHYLHFIPGAGLLGIDDFKIDLVAVAALLTLVGYSVSDTIVVFDRIREVRGKNPKLVPQMINDSVNQTLSRTILTATTVFLVSIVLYAFGGEGVHLFAFVMVIGVLVGTYSSIFVAAPLLLAFGEGHDEHAPAAVEEPANKEGAEEEVVEG
ncbi:protein-export membrane protein secd : Protein-export membrane protein secD OS=Planctomyces maris DSM 8797 GN=PM8797T_31765 PE=3 SV=1: SecD_SecF: SecD_SecF [Gemmataceae bacterium]|nr:protein-export membrane protein secd : Protein-export membrane protein secD OS=Planctomyces maris DSM 8797 GN=PM8797T_31765 PE=3 SV=1: SecD_SecF: SecD_SecF [Gemmataceae bacterium]VTT99287.1 protein-export membrane protein secd : Protein-export membrane protein secD OS=Planctomyces maris DSM 8797 GN=PM8797T_31765 PE=3 SV=1: SecD_SecF: SecD_SecF [Gemmataceae bacterium]